MNCKSPSLVVTVKESRLREITYVGPLQAAVIISIVTAIVAAITSFALSVLPILVSGGAATAYTFFYWLVIPLVAGATAFGSTAAGCIVYNFVARKFGGIKIVLS